MARGPGVEPGFSDPESDVLPIRRSPNESAPGGPCLLGRLSRRQTTPAFNDVKARYIISCWPIFISNKHNHLSQPRQALRLIVYILRSSPVSRHVRTKGRVVESAGTRT